MRCLSPPLKWIVPASPIIVLYVSGSLSMKSWHCAAFAERITSSSLASSMPIRIFSYTVSLNINGSWKTKPILSINFSIGIPLMFILPTNISPLSISHIRGIKCAIVVLPAPLGPTSAVTVPSFILKLISWRISLFVYEKLTSLNSISLFRGTADSDATASGNSGW